MESCCSSNSMAVKTDAKPAVQCPCCGAAAKPVERLTLMHQIIAPLNRELPPDDFFFCSSTACRTVYFSSDGAVIETSKVRGVVGQKSTLPDRVLCYCFDVSHARVMEEIEKTGTSASKDFVVQQTKLKNCACEIRNPSGKCCLKAFPK
ncbi:MAG: hypothetical protein V7707_20755 [Motiliproteus sp.]